MDPIVKALQRAGRIEEGVERGKAALATLGEDQLDPVVAGLDSAVGSTLAFAGRHAEAAGYLEQALITAQALDLPETLCQALNAQAVSYMNLSRFDEALGLWAVLENIAERHGLAEFLSQALANAGNVGVARDLPEAADRLRASMAQSRRIGDFYGLNVSTGNLMLHLLFSGEWEQVERLAQELPAASIENLEDVHVRLACLKAWRGEPAEDHIAALEGWRTGGNVETRYIAMAAGNAVALAEGRHEEVLAGGTDPLKEIVQMLGPLHESMRHLWPDTLQAAIALDRVDLASELVEMLAVEPRGRISPYLRAELHRGRGLVSAARGEHEEVEKELRAAVAGLEALGYPFPLARAQIDLAEWLIGRGRPAESEPLLSEAVVALTPLRAVPALTRANSLLSHVPASAA
jgi:tetratricopeptide (TPR) repeat protein